MRQLLRLAEQVFLFFHLTAVAEWCYYKEMGIAIDQVEERR